MSSGIRWAAVVLLGDDDTITALEIDAPATADVVTTDRVDLLAEAGGVVVPVDLELDLRGTVVRPFDAGRQAALEILAGLR